MKHVREFTNILPQSVRYRLRQIAFKGRAVKCVLCGNEVRGFVAHGGGPEVLDRRKVAGGMRREEDRCPVCHGCDRTRMIALYLERVVGIGQERHNILHVAPDYGLYLWLKRQPSVSYTGTDIDARRYRHIDNMKAANLTDTPFESNLFDLVICSHVLEHVPDDMKAMQEIRRILKPGGYAILLVPLALDGLGLEEDPFINDPESQERRFGQWDHVRLYSKEAFLSRMSEAGFKVSIFCPFDEAPEDARHLRLNPLEVLPIGRKTEPS